MGRAYERDLVRRPCIAHIREMISFNQLKRYKHLYWTAPPDVGKVRPWVAHQMMLDGYSKGNFDMVIIGYSEDEVKVWLIEFKYGKNSYTKEQKAIADSCEGTPVDAIKIYSIDEFQEFIKENLK